MQKISNGKQHVTKTKTPFKVIASRLASISSV
jgi:hypothetical protein